MIIEFSSGKIVANQFEVVIKIIGPQMITMQSQADAIELIAGANIVLANGSGLKWSVKLDDESQMKKLSEELGIELR